LDDPRLSLPAPVYHLAGEGGYGLRETVDARHEWGAVRDVPFFAIPPGRAHDGLVPVGSPALFYGLPPLPAAGEKGAPNVVPLYEYRDARTKAVRYATEPDATEPAARPVCRVWRNPSTVLALDVVARPAP